MHRVGQVPSFIRLCPGKFSCVGKNREGDVKRRRRRRRVEGGVEAGGAGRKAREGVRLDRVALTAARFPRDRGRSDPHSPPTECGLRKQNGICRTTSLQGLWIMSRYDAAPVLPLRLLSTLELVSSRS